MYIIRRALAQSVSDHRPLERDNKKRNFQISSENVFFQKWIQKLPTPGKGLRNGPRNELMFCFLLKQMFLVQTARTRGGLSGSPRPGT